MFFSNSDRTSSQTIQQQLEYDRTNLAGVERIIAFASGKDRVGKTTIAVNLAVMLAQTGLQIGLLDAEVHSDRSLEILGLQDRYLESSANSARPVDNFGVKLVKIDSPRDEDPLEDWCDEWCNYWLNREIKQTLEETQWGDLDYLIINLPPRMGDEHLTLAQALAIDGVVMVATHERDTHPDIYQTLKMFERLNVPILGLVENKRDLFSVDLSKRKYEIRDSDPSNPKIRIPFLGYVPLYPAVSQYTERGLPIVITEPSSMFASALQIIIWAIASRIKISPLKLRS